MVETPKLRVFADANILIRGITLPRYPYEILRLAAEGEITLPVSESVLADATVLTSTHKLTPAGMGR
jgi:predicted nucleic acid-binding protein